MDILLSSGAFAVGVLFGAAAVYGWFRRAIRFALQSATALDTFAWSLQRDPMRQTPGEDDLPLLYILPAGGRTNSCDEARVAWLGAAIEGRDFLLAHAGLFQDSERFAEVVEAMRATTTGRTADHKAEMRYLQ